MRTIPLLVAALLATAAGAHAGEPAPNVVIVYADDLGYGDLSAYGATRFQTPRIDRLARVPMIVRWPGRVKPGVSDALVGQVDFLASFAALTGQALARQDAPDSLDVLGALLGTAPTGRGSLVEQAGALSLITKKWKLISPHEGRKVNPETNTELGNDPQPQLYDLSADLGERRNVAGEHPEVLRELAEQLARIRLDGRSRP